MPKVQFIIELLSKDDVVRAIRKNMDGLLSAVPELKDVVGGVISITTWTFGNMLCWHWDIRKIGCNGF